MTKEEAIAILDGFKHNPLLNEQHFEALDMAISAINTIELIKTSSSFTNLQKTAIEEMMRGKT